MEGLRQDLRHAVRSLTKAKGFTAATVLTLALGIGANTAIFSVVSGVLLRPLPLAHPERLVQLYATSSFSPQGEAVGRADLETFRSESTSFDALAGYEVSARYLRGPAGAERVMTVAAEPDFFSMLGVAPIAGRTFQPGDPRREPRTRRAPRAVVRRRRGEDDPPAALHLVWRGRPRARAGVRERHQPVAGARDASHA